MATTNVKMTKDCIMCCDFMPMVEMMVYKLRN